MLDEKKDVQPDEKPQTLKRGIRGWQVGFIALGGIIGSGYFLGTGWTYNEMGPGIILGYLLVGFIVYGVMISYAELLVNLPRTGSFVAYTREFMNPSIAAGMGWSFFANWAAYVPAECLAVGTMIHVFVKGDPGNIFWYSLVTLALLTTINLIGVDIFAKIESFLSMTKVFAILLFIVIALGIWLGLWGNAGGFVGTSVVLADTSKSLVEQLLPVGPLMIMIMLVGVLVNFQGTEIIGMTAAETDDPETAVPRACKAVVFRVAFLFIVPLTLIVLLKPYQEAGLDDSIFSVVLKDYGLDTIAWIFTAIVIVAAFSCANTGLYATSRVVYSLAIEGLAPQFLSKLNKKRVPKYAVMFTILPMWAVLLLGWFLPNSSFYEWLLGIAGFTGTTCWMGIIGSQLIFRRKLKKKGYDTSQLRVRVKHMWVPVVSICAQAAALLSLLLDMAMWPVFFISLSCFLIPAVILHFVRKLGKARSTQLPEGEVAFEEKYGEELSKDA